MHTGRRTVFIFLDIAIRNSLRSNNVQPHENVDPSLAYTIFSKAGWSGKRCRAPREVMGRLRKQSSDAAPAYHASCYLGIPAGAAVTGLHPYALSPCRPAALYLRPEDILFLQRNQQSTDSCVPRNSTALKLKTANEQGAKSVGLVSLSG